MTLLLASAACAVISALCFRHAIRLEVAAGVESYFQRRRRLHSEGA